MWAEGKAPGTAAQIQVKILHCIHSLKGGGAERQLKLLVNTINSPHIKNIVFCVNDNGRRDINQDVKIFKSTYNGKYNIALFKDIHELIQTEKPDLLHAWLPASMTIPAMIVAKLNRIPTIYSYRSKMHFHRTITVPELFVAFLAATKVISNNPVEQSNLFYRLLFSVKNGVVVPNAVEVRPEYIKMCKGMVPGERIKLLSIGRLTPAKNLGLLIKALSNLRDYDWSLVICGEGEDRARLENLTMQLELSDRIEFSGYSDNIHKYIYKSDLLILPSKFEGMPNVLVESIAHGLPVLPSNIFPHKWILGDDYADYMYDPESPEQLSGLLKMTFITPYILKKYHKLGLQAAKNYSVSDHGLAYVNIYGSLSNGWLRKS